MALQPCNPLVSVTGNMSHLTMVSWSWDDIFVFSSYDWTDTWLHTLTDIGEQKIHMLNTKFHSVISEFMYFVHYICVPES